LKRIDEYVMYIARNNPSLDELKEKGLEIGRGKGDITRFLERLRVVEVSNGLVVLTAVGRTLVSLREWLGPAVYHALFYQRVPQYRLLIDIAREKRSIDLEELYVAVNDRLSHISPSAWINKVAFKTLLQIAEDLGVLRRQNGVYNFLEDPITSAVQEYYTQHGVRIGQSFYVTQDKVTVRECGKEEPPHGLYRVDISCVVVKIYNVFADEI
jgi:hypothetical protein